MKRAFICVQATLKENCVGAKILLKSSVMNYISLDDSYDLSTLRKHFVETQFNKIQQEDYDYTIISLSQLQ